MINKMIDIYCDKDLVEAGIYVCVNCGQKVFIEKKSKLNPCKKCGFKKFTLEKLL